MPTVLPPSDGGYQYYKTRVAELEDELKTETAKTKKGYEERLGTVEENYRTDLRRRDDSHERAVDNLKHETDKTIENDRETAKNDLQQIKRQTYDKFGRYALDDKEAMRHQLLEADSAIQYNETKSRNALEAAEQKHDKILLDTHKQHGRELEEASSNSRSSQNELYSHSEHDKAQALESERKSLQGQYHDLNAQLQDEIKFQGKRADAQIQSSQDQFKNNQSQLELSEKALSEKRARAMTEGEEHRTRELNASHADLVSQAQNQMKKIADVAGEYNKGISEGRADAVKSYENEWRSKEQVASEAYQRNMDDLGSQAHQSDRYYSNLNDKTLKEKDRYFAGVISQQYSEAHQSQKDLESIFEKNTQGLELRNQKDRREAEVASDRQTHLSQDDKEKALGAQAKTYQDKMVSDDISHRTEVNLLEQHLNERISPKNVGEISPAAEEIVRKSVSSEYKKSFDAEQERNKAQAESLVREYSSRLRDTVVQSQGHETVMARENTAQRQMDQNQFLQHVSDVESLKETTLRDQVQIFEKQAATAEKNHAVTLDRLKREYEELISTTRFDATARIADLRQQSDFNSKMAQRAFSARQNEIIREYEKKLADQKSEADAALYDVKAQGDLKLRETERHLKQQLEEQAKGYENRLVQQDAQQKERERIVAQNNQDELEKVKRSNALLLYKKS